MAEKTRQQALVLAHSALKLALPNASDESGILGDSHSADFRGVHAYVLVTCPIESLALVTDRMPTKVLQMLSHHEFESPQPNF